MIDLMIVIMGTLIFFTLVLLFVITMTIIIGEVTYRGYEMIQRRRGR